MQIEQGKISKNKIHFTLIKIASKRIASKTRKL